MPDIPIASSALLDQVAARMAEQAALAKTIYDAYLKAGFSEDQAFTLLKAKLHEAMLTASAVNPVDEDDE